MYSHLTDCVFLNTFNQIDWEKIMNDLSNQDGLPITTDKTKWNLTTPGYNEIYQIWDNAKFNINSIKWINYYPIHHYDQELINNIKSYLKLKGIHRSWISRIDPGFYAPWHWDVDDQENIYLKKGIIKRYSIMMNLPAMGHIFILGNDYLFNTPQGSIFEWKNYKDWHSGINAGLTSKFMLNILGY
jgi:hypothetical protein